MAMPGKAQRQPRKGRQEAAAAHKRLGSESGAARQRRGGEERTS